MNENLNVLDLSASPTQRVEPQRNEENLNSTTGDIGGGDSETHVDFPLDDITNTSIDEILATTLSSLHLETNEMAMTDEVDSEKPSSHSGHNSMSPFPSPTSVTSLADVAAAIRSNRLRKVIVMCGAGLSVSAGIPDFRSPGTGLYSQLEKYDLPFPEAIFSIDYFFRNPMPFYTLASELWPGVSTYRPTPGHAFIRLLHDKDLLVRCYTQNIDGLERLAGLPGDSLVEAHGTFSSASCSRCREPHSPDLILESLGLSQLKSESNEETRGTEILRRSNASAENVLDDSDIDVENDVLVVDDNKNGRESLPQCGRCQSGILKPDIVFFGESLPDRFSDMSSVDFDECDLLIVMGTSLSVQPFSSLIHRCPDTCIRLLINREEVGTISQSESESSNDIHDDDAEAEIPRPIGFDFSERSRDVFFQGNCDDGVRELAKLCGWHDDLREIEEQISSN